jgi:hypothetical protein
MTSDQQIAANQNNARKSTGPRSKAGRAVSSRNAVQHRLAIDIRSDPEFQDDIEKLADAVSKGTQIVREGARKFAEAEINVWRIQNVRASLFEKYYFARAASPDGLVELNENLVKLERYERRAFSKRKRALCALRGS